MAPHRSRPLAFSDFMGKHCIKRKYNKYYNHLLGDIYNVHILHVLECTDNRKNGRVRTFALTCLHLCTDFRRISVSGTSGWFIFNCVPDLVE